MFYVPVSCFSLRLPKTKVSTTNHTTWSHTRVPVMLITQDTSAAQLPHNTGLVAVSVGVNPPQRGVTKPQIQVPWYTKAKLMALKRKTKDGDGEKRGPYEKWINRQLIDRTVSNLYIPRNIPAKIFKKAGCQIMHIIRSRWSIITWNKLPPTSLTAQHCYQCTQYKYNCKTLSWGKSSKVPDNHFADCRLSFGL